MLLTLTYSVVFVWKRMIPESFETASWYSNLCCLFTVPGAMQRLLGVERWTLSRFMWGTDRSILNRSSSFWDVLSIRKNQIQNGWPWCSGFSNINPPLFFLTDYHISGLLLFKMIMFCSDLLFKQSENLFERFPLVSNPVIVVFLYILKLLA